MVASSHLDKLLLDSSTTVQQKTDCLKLLKIVVKNLCDPVKAQDPKYRQLKLDNEKVRAKILACAAAIPLLHALGFAETTDENQSRVLRLSDTQTMVDASIMTSALHEITSTLTQLDPSATSAGAAATNPQQPKKARTTASNSFAIATTTTNQSNTSKFSVVESKFTEKQKARRLLEQKEQRERELAKQQRKQNIKLLKQDKYVRENDENWTSGVSAACAKSGDSISTFRDKYGE